MDAEGRPDACKAAAWQTAGMSRMPAVALVVLSVLLPAAPGPARAAGAEQVEGGRHALNLIGYQPWRSGWAVYNMLIVGDGNRIVELPGGRPLWHGKQGALDLAIFDPDRLLAPPPAELAAEFDRMLALLARGQARLFAQRPRVLQLELHLIGPARQVRTEFTTEVARDAPVRLRFVLAGGRDQPRRRWIERATELLAHEIYHVSQWGRWVGDPISSEAAAHLWGLCARAALGFDETWSLVVDEAGLGSLWARRTALLTYGPEQAGAGTVQASSRLGRLLAHLELRAALGRAEARLPADGKRIQQRCEGLVDGVPPLLIGLPDTLERLDLRHNRRAPAQDRTWP